MIEIAKSMMGLLWAGTIFGGREMMHMLVHQNPQAAVDDAAFLMGQMSEAMASRLGPAGQTIFRSGLQVQSGFADQWLTPLSPDSPAGTGWGPVVHEE